ncbi:MAG: hypothetical protein NVS3B20_08630 [Polyangiales bacterium]
MSSESLRSRSDEGAVEATTEQGNRGELEVTMGGMEAFLHDPSLATYRMRTGSRSRGWMWILLCLLIGVVTAVVASRVADVELLARPGRHGRDLIVRRRAHGDAHVGDDAP